VISANQCNVTGKHDIVADICVAGYMAPMSTEEIIADFNFTAPTKKRAPSEMRTGSDANGRSAKELDPRFGGPDPSDKPPNH
jgi:hypothetical protein